MKNENRKTNKITKQLLKQKTIHIYLSFNNTIITITNKKKTLKILSTGNLGFKKSKRATTYASQKLGIKVIEWLKKNTTTKENLANYTIEIKGIGEGKDAVIKTLTKAGLNITSIFDKTPVAHNGTKKSKRRRI